MAEPTQAEIEESNRIKSLPVIEEINNEMDGLKEGQEELMNAIKEETQRNQQAFDKGDRKFDDLDKRMDEMGTQIADGFKDQKDNLEKHLAETKDNQITELKKIITNQQDVDEKKQDRKNYVKDGIIITLVGGILLTLVIEYLSPVSEIIK